jgi:hypothetical protein
MSIVAWSGKRAERDLMLVMPASPDGLSPGLISVGLRTVSLGK